MVLSISRSALCPFHPRPVDAPDTTQADPNERAPVLGRGRQREMVQVVDSGVEATGVRCLGEAETFPIEVMAELVQQSVKEAAIGRHLPADRCAHPDANPLLPKVIVTEELRVAAFPQPLRSCPEHPQFRPADGVGSSEEAKNRITLDADPPRITSGKRPL